jgi:endogenous inhibitor of DNA gyrase (YacG/DUF329 family)
MQHRCPTCKKQFQPDESPALPFCSQRCRMIDLGRWLDEEVGIPIEREDSDEELPPDPDEDEDG